MSVEQAILVGLLAATGTYLVLHRTLTRIILGLGLLGNAINLMILTSGGDPGEPPIVGREGEFTDPVPQALVLTAIVIGFGVISFLLAMAYRAWTIDGNDQVEDDITDRRLAERAPAEPTPEFDPEFASDLESPPGSGPEERS